MKSEKYDRFKKFSAGIEGWFNDLSISLFDILLAYQAEKNIRGGIMEIGAWHGKSASMLAVHLRESEKLHVFDIEVRQELSENIEKLRLALGANIELVKANSFTKITPAFCNENYRAFRAIHIDGDHSEYGVYNDMLIANTLLHPHGVLIVDDFLNERFPQISQVAFEFTSSHKQELCLLLSGGNKGYFVRPKVRDDYYDFLKNTLSSELALRGLSVNIYWGTNNGYPCIGVRRE